MPWHTVFLGRLLGLYTLMVTLWLLADQHAATTMIEALVGNPGLHVLVALITLGLGLAMVLGHQRWSGGALPVLVTMIGWGMLLRGLLLLFLSPDQVLSLVRTLRVSTFFYAYLAVPLVLGLYLTYAGFTTRLPSRA
jgi:hypothetical protein